MNSNARDIIAPRSDQLNYIDVPDGITADITVREVRKGNDIQRMNIYIENEKRIYKPCLTMMRVLFATWGDKYETEWAGKSIRIYGDPDIMFGPKQRGGIRISHVSDIDAPMDILVPVGNHSSMLWHVKPLIIQPASDISKADLCRGWLKDIGETEADACALIQKDLNDATDEDFELIKKRYKK